MSSLEEAYSYLSSFTKLHRSEVVQVVSKRKELNSVRKTLQSLIASGASVEDVQPLYQQITSITNDLNSRLLYVKSLIKSKKVAEAVVASTSPVSPTALIPPSLVTSLQATLEIAAPQATFTSVYVNEIILPGAVITSNSSNLILGGNCVKYTPIMDDAVCIITPRSATGNTAASLVNINSTSIYGYEFVSNGTREISFCCQLPHTWEEGSSVEPHIHWVPSNSNTGTAVFDMDYWVTNIGEAMPQSQHVSVTVAGRGVAYCHQLTSYGSISMTGKTASCIFGARMYRVGGASNDTFTGSCFVLSVDLHIYNSRTGHNIVT